MLITVHYSTKTGTIKKAFNHMFPNLKMEFLKPAKLIAGEISMGNIVLHNRYVGEINRALKQGAININGDYKVKLIEQLFEQHFGLPVQVFQKQKKTWIETTNTNELTLFQQNERGAKSRD